MTALPFVIIGAGVAAISAVETLRAHDRTTPIVLITRDGDGYYSRPGLAYLLSGEVSEKLLTPRRRSEIAALGVSWLTAEVQRIDRAARLIHCDRGRPIAYRRLLLALGARAVAPEFANAGISDIFTLDSLDDARRLIAAARRGRRAVVVGGGITALELAEGLAARECRVTYLLRGERFWSSVLDAEESAIIIDRLRAHGITVLTQTEPVRAVGRAGRLTALQTADGREIPADLCAAAIGTRPNRELAQAAGLAVSRGILTDACLRTDDPLVFAAGDCCERVDATNGRPVLSTLWSTARDHGRAAALGMLGMPTEPTRRTAVNVTLLAGLPTTLIGEIGHGRDGDLVAIARGESESWQSAAGTRVVLHRAELDRLRLIVRGDRLCGAVLMGHQRLSAPLQQLIESGRDIQPLLPLLDGDLHRLAPAIEALAAEEAQ